MNCSKNVRVGLLKLSLLGLLLLMGRDIARAQVSASITGRIVDASGSAVPGVTVTVTSPDTGETRTASSDDSGDYRVLSLPVGRYNVRAEKNGFKSVEQTGINLVVGQEGVVNLQLEVGQVQQQVTVTGEAQLINTTTADISGLVNEQEVKELPLNGRSFDMLITLNAGAVNFSSLKVTQGTGAGLGNVFSVSGRHFFENLFLMNGVEYAGPSQVHSNPGGVSGQLLGIDAVREFNVMSDTYGAEYGKRAGAQITIVTQSGTNALHGSAFEFLRNSVLDARNFFDHPLGERIPPFKRNQFGGALGGPIRKDKTFIFGNYEGFRQRLGVSDVTIVPDNGVRSSTPTINGVAVTNVNPGMLPYLGFWPVQNGADLGNGAAYSYSNPLQSIREDFGTVRVDHTFSAKDQLATSYMVDDGYNLTPLPDPLFNTITTLRSQVLSLQETHLFSPNLINTFTVGFSRAGFFFYTPPAPGFPSGLNFVTGLNAGRISISGSTQNTGTTLTLAGSAATPLYVPRRNVFTYEDAMQMIRGRHQISYGIWFERLQSNETGGTNQSGAATFSTLTSFLQGTVSNFAVSPTTTTLYWRQLEGAWYVQDSIQLRPNLTIRVGLRQDFNNGWNDAHGRAANFGISPTGTLLTVPVVGSSVYTQNNAKLLFGPRVGIAWDPFGKGKTSIRGGVGTYYDDLDEIGFLLDVVPPFNGLVAFTNTAFLPLLPINPATPVPAQCNTGVPTPCTTYQPEAIQPNAKTPTVEEWNLSVQQQLSANTSLTLSYVGSHGFHEIIYEDLNTVPAQVCLNAAGCGPAGGVGKTTTANVPQGTTYIPVATRPNPFLGSSQVYVSAGNSSYNSLLVELAHRFGSGLEFRANYTWSKDLDDSSGMGGAAAATSQVYTVMNPNNLSQDWGPSAEDITHKFVLSGSYELPFGQNKLWLNGLSGTRAKLVYGWKVNWIATVLSGYPFTVTVGSNQSGNGDAKSPDRPNLATGFTSIPTSGVTPAQCGSNPAGTPLGTPTLWYYPCAVSIPTAGTWGNLGRDTMRGPGLGTLDFSLFKDTSITERVKLQFRVESFNLLNRANFNMPGIGAFSGGTVNPSAGVITSTSTDPRRLQFGLKTIF